MEDYDMRYMVTARGTVHAHADGLRAALRMAAPAMGVQPAPRSSTDALIEALLVRGGRVTIVVEHAADDARADVTVVTVLPTPTPEVES